MDTSDFPSRKPVIAVPNWGLILLLIAYALPGNIGHMPWRGDDVLHIGIAHGMLRSGNWLTPQIAGMPYVDWPPLTYWLGSIFGTALGWLIPVHDAIRLSTAAGLVAFVVLLRFAAYEIYGRDAATGTALLLLGSLGLLVHAHEMQPQIMVAAALASTLYGLALLPKQGTRGAVFAGTGTGCAFLAGGLSGLVLTLPLWLSQLLAGRDSRWSARPRAYLLATFIAGTLVLAWPAALATWQPEYLSLWLHQELNDVTPHSGHLQRISALFSLIGWFSWPLWPVALWSLWRRRGEYRAFGHTLPLASLLAALSVVVLTGNMRPANLVPLLAPLALIATAELCRLRRGAANAFDWFGVMTFSLLGLFLWAGWTAVNFGWPAPLARNIGRMLPGYHPSWLWPELFIALALSAAWIVAILRVPFFQLRGAVHAALGVTLTWGLATTLWLSWFDYDKNYGPLVIKIAALTRPAGQGCLAGLEVGDVQRAAFSYFADLTVDTSVRARERCPLLLAYASGKRAAPEPGTGWKKIWQDQRGRGRFQEQFALYQRSNLPPEWHARLPR